MCQWCFNILNTWIYLACIRILNTVCHIIMCGYCVLCESVAWNQACKYRLFWWRDKATVNHWLVHGDHAFSASFPVFFINFGIPNCGNCLHVIKQNTRNNKSRVFSVERFFLIFVLIWELSHKKTRNPEAELQGHDYFCISTNCMNNYWIQ